MSSLSAILRDQIREIERTAWRVRRIAGALRAAGSIAEGDGMQSVGGDGTFSFLKIEDLTDLFAVLADGLQRHADRIESLCETYPEEKP